jgi:hypothetical protein
MISDEQKTKREEMKKLAKKARNESYYEKTKANRIECEICSCSVASSYWSAHIQTKRHTKWEEIKKKAEPVVEVVPEKKTRKTKK